MSRVSIAFVGCGNIAPYHLKGVHSNNNIIYVSALIDPDSQKVNDIKQLCDDFNSKQEKEGGGGGGGGDAAEKNPGIVSFSNLEDAIAANNKAHQETGIFFTISDIILTPFFHRKVYLYCSELVVASSSPYSLNHTCFTV